MVSGIVVRSRRSLTPCVSITATAFYEQRTRRQRACWAPARWPHSRCRRGCYRAQAGGRCRRAPDGEEACRGRVPVAVLRATVQDRRSLRPACILVPVDGASGGGGGIGPPGH